MSASPPAPLPDLAGHRVAVVGNAPEMGDHADAIDGAACVLRLNDAAGFGGRAGRRTTHLVLVNRGGQMRAWLDDPGFLDRPAVRAAGAFVLPFPPLGTALDATGARICWTREALAALAPLGRPVHVLPEGLHAEGRRRLSADTPGRPNPSTGFLATLAALLGRPPGAPPVAAYGFGFAGWSGHPWSAERRWFEAEHAAGRLRLHPLRPAATRAPSPPPSDTAPVSAPP